MKEMDASEIHHHSLGEKSSHIADGPVYPKRVKTVIFIYKDVKIMFMTQSNS